MPTNLRQAKIETLGREILARMRGETPHVFQRKGMAGRILCWYSS